MSKEILTAVGNQLMAGAEFHSKMMEFYTFLGLDDFRSFQCDQMNEELENFHDFIYHVADRHKVLLNCRHAAIPEVMPADFYTKSTLEVDETAIKAFLKSSLQTYHDWEAAAKKKLIAYADKLLELHDHVDYHYVCNLVDDVVEEIYHLETLIEELKSVSYDCHRVPHLKHKLNIK